MRNLQLCRDRRPAHTPEEAAERFSSLNDVPLSDDPDLIEQYIFSIADTDIAAIRTCGCYPPGIRRKADARHLATDSLKITAFLMESRTE